jgi:hypothetical protein
MASSTPSRARIINVLEALATQGHQPGRIVVSSDGGFSVEVMQSAERTSYDNTDAAPPKWPGSE